MPPGENITVMHRVRPGQVLSEITVPIRAGTRSTFIKYAMRNSWDFASPAWPPRCGSTNGMARDVRIVLGGVAPIPWRSGPPSGRSRAGRSIETTIESAARASIAAAHPLAHNEYKVALVKKLVRAALTELAQ